MFSNHDLVVGVARCCVGTLSRDTLGFQIIFHPAGLVGHKKEFVAGRCFGLFFFSLMVVALFARQREKSDGVFSVVWAPILVTTLISR